MKNSPLGFNRYYNKSNMGWFFLMIPLLLISANSCSKDKINEDTLGEFNGKIIEHEGIERTYQLYLPNNFDSLNAAPLVFALHGGGGTASNFEDVVSSGTLTTAAEARGMVLIMPDGIDKRWNDGRPEIFGNDSMHDDVGFISAIIDDMIQNYGIDASRVYATGISNGGFMSMRLALDLSNKIAAVAPVTAQVTEVMQSKVPEFPISIMIVNGEADPLVPFNGGCIDVPLTPNCSRGNVLSTEESIEKFIAFNKCTDPSEGTELIDAFPNDDTSVEITSYNDCDLGKEVVLVKVIGGGHTWPSGAQYLPDSIVGAVSREINASERILDFFLSHSRN